MDRVKNEMFRFFRSHFSKDQSASISLTGLIIKSVSDYDNVSLVAPFLEEEVKSAVCGCGSNKSPGPNGFTFKFIKKM